MNWGRPGSKQDVFWTMQAQNTKARFIMMINENGFTNKYIQELENSLVS